MFFGVYFIKYFYYIFIKKYILRMYRWKCRWQNNQQGGYMYTDERDCIVAELRNLPTVEYPPEVIERLNAKSQVLKQQIATGEIVPRSALEIIAELGIELD